jgi:hypothetical protein
MSARTRTRTVLYRARAPFSRVRRAPSAYRARVHTSIAFLHLILLLAACFSLFFDSFTSEDALYRRLKRSAPRSD